MIHRNDERVFRFVEVTCYGSALMGGMAFRVIDLVTWPYGIPLIFFLLSSAGLVFMTRFFIYAHPERISDRTRAATIEIPTHKRILLIIGFAMCVPMFLLGVIGLCDPLTMERVISAISMGWLLP